MVKLPIFQPLLILSPPLQHWRPPKRRQIFPQFAHLCAICAFALPLWSVGDPLDGGGDVPNQPIWGPLLMVSRTIKRSATQQPAGVVSPISPMVGHF